MYDQQLDFNPLNPPVVDQPTFMPPVADPLLSQPAWPQPAPHAPAVAETPKAVFTKTRVLVGSLIVAVIGLGIGTGTQAAKAGRLDDTLHTTQADLAKTRSDLTAKAAEADGLRSRISTLESEKADLSSQNDTLTQFGASVASLVADLDQCVDLNNQFISDIADGYFWSSGDIHRLVSLCNDAQSKAAALDNLLTS